MAKLYMLKGLPGCGKSTRAFEMLAAATRPMKRINNDDLRAMIDGGKWSKSNEPVIRLVREKMIHEFLGRNYDVIVDNLNLRPQDEETYRQMAATYNAQFEVLDMTGVSVHTCVERDRKRAKPVGEKVIWGWYRDFIAPSQRKRWKEDPKGKPKAILADLDGTLAEGIGVHRGPFEWDKVGFDEVVEPVLAVVRNWLDSGEEVIFMSGRDEVCRPQTEEWLKALGLYWDCQLFMRPQGDMRPDTVVKRELFEKYVEPNWNISFVIDDRPSVVRMWRELGLFVFDVGLGIDF